MKIGSLVELISPQDEEGKRLCPIQMGVVYTVSAFTEGRFKDGWQPAIRLEEVDQKFAFCKKYFKEVQPPMDMDFITEFQQQTA